MMLILFFKSRISSTPLLDAASISIISFDCLFLYWTQLEQFSQGIASKELAQLIVLANIFATLVLPVPLGPVNK